MPTETRRAIAHALAWLETEALTLHDIQNVVHELPEKTTPEEVVRHVARTFDAPEHRTELTELVELVRVMPRPPDLEEGERFTALVDIPLSRWDEFRGMIHRGRPAFVT